MGRDEIGLIRRVPGSRDRRRRARQHRSTRVRPPRGGVGAGHGDRRRRRLRRASSSDRGHRADRPRRSLPRAAALRHTGADARTARGPRHAPVRTSPCWRPSAFHPTVSSEIDRLGDAVPFVESSRVGRPDIFHRPFQVRSLHELADCLSIGERLVLTQQDMIVDRTRVYANSDDAWHDYRVRHRPRWRPPTRSGSSLDTLHSTPRVRAPSSSDRATVVTLGVDHLSHMIVDDSVVRPLGGRPFLLVIGNSYWHKNRLFAFRLLRHLVEAHGWDGGLVLAGGHPDRGSSRAGRAGIPRRHACAPRRA